MSVEEAKKFVDLVDKEPALQQKFREGWANIEKLASDNGLHVSRADLQQHLRERWGISKPANADEKDTCTICIPHP
jgi:hypothetical protein